MERRHTADPLHSRRELEGRRTGDSSETRYLMGRDRANFFTQKLSNLIILLSRLKNERSRDHSAPGAKRVITADQRTKQKREGFVYYKTTDPNFSFKNVSREYLMKH